MGFLAKSMILLHGLVALVAFTFTLTLYINRPNWKTVENGPKGRIDAATEKLRAEEPFAKAAFTTVTGNHLTILQLEQERYPRREFYDSQLSLVEEGTLQKGTPRIKGAVVQELEVDNATEFLNITRKTGRKPIQFRTGEDAKSLSEYRELIDSTIKQIATLQESIKMVNDERAKVNQEIVGTVDPFTKGLRTRLREQELITEQAVAEASYLDTFVNNSEADSGLIRKRYNALMFRLQELDKLR
ncbi:MAG: hypothetical protein N2112_04465 [Gemmataceae bacterium]|nr:hypothetical protein [Gemmataceae bacterium]